MEEFVYVSAKPGVLVPRFISLSQPVAQYIGATRFGKDIKFAQGAVVAIPLSEWNRFRREYNRRVQDGTLVKRTKEDFDRWNASRSAKNEPQKPAAKPAKKKAASAAGEGDSE